METKKDELPEIPDRSAKDRNEDLANQLHISLSENKKGIMKLRAKLSVTFWTIIILSLVTFATGIVLLSVPVISALGGKIDQFTAITAGGFGIANLVGLVLYGPIDKIHNLMGDMSQLILELNSNQVQISLRLMEMDKEKRETIGFAAEKICNATEASIISIQQNFENTPLKPENTPLKPTTVN